MIYVPPILELSIYGVLEPGIPNRERVCLRPTDIVNLSQFGLLAAIRNPNGAVSPISNLFFWFGDKTVTPPSWLIVVTGKGQPGQFEENGKMIYVFFWDLSITIFDIPGIVPVAFRMNSILVGHNILPEGKQLTDQAADSGKNPAQPKATQ